MGRSDSHKTETKSRDWFRSAVGSNEKALFRDISERDYGVDGLIELFDDGEVTGKIAFVQLKGTDKTICPLKRSPMISCLISTSSVGYALQNQIPFIIAYISIKEPNICYWGILQKLITEDIKTKKDEQDTVTVHIPQEQFFKTDSEILIEAINDFYNKVNR